MKKLSIIMCLSLFAFGFLSCPEQALALDPPTLVSIDTGAGHLDKTFSPDTLNYTIILADNISSFTLSATAPSTAYDISYSVPQPMNLSLGSNPLTVSVSIPGGDSKTYTFDIRREGRFITEWITTVDGTQITLPLVKPGSEIFNCNVDWGDGTATSTITDANRSTANKHVYVTAGTYRISISGECEGWSLDSISASENLIVRVLSWGASPVFTGFKELDFMGAGNLRFLASGGIKGPACTDAESIFASCAQLNTLPSDLFRYLTEVENFSGAFYECIALSTIPSDLFRYNTKAFNFYYLFNGCSGLQTLPVDFFRYNSAALYFGAVFYGCTNLQTVPADFFRYNIAAIDFNGTFYNCNNLTLHATIFYAPGEEATRFAGKTVDFGACFSRTGFIGIQGTAPNLWACSFLSVTNGACFGGTGNSSTSLSNYTDIPVGWK